jgi:hypothetical protein
MVGSRNRHQSSHFRSCYPEASPKASLWRFVVARKPVPETIPILEAIETFTIWLSGATSQGERQGERGDIQLTERNPKFNYVHTVTVGATSPYSSTAELNDWEMEKNKLASASLGDKTILSTVKITQL